jgi:hypothetical protein
VAFIVQGLNCGASQSHSMMPIKVALEHFDLRDSPQANLFIVLIVHVISWQRRRPLSGMELLNFVLSSVRSAIDNFYI